MPLGDYEKAFGGDEAGLKMFLANARRFERHFCELMVTGSDFNLQLEVRGANGKMVHCKLKNEGWDRPKGKEQKLDNPPPDRTLGG